MTGADPAARELRLATAEGSEEVLRYDHLIVALGSVSRVLPVPGLAEHAHRLQDPLGGDRAAQSRDPAPRDRRGARRPRGAARLPHLRLRGGRLRRPRGHRRAAGLRRRRARPLSALPTRRHPLAAGRGPGPGDARDPRLARRLRHPRAARPRAWRSAPDTRIDAVDESTRAPLHRRGDPGAHRVLDRRGGAARRWSRGSACRWPRTAGSRPTPTLRVRGHENVWAVGDAAAVPDPGAARQARPARPPPSTPCGRASLVADNVARGARPAASRGKFRYRTLGVFVDMGQHKAVATMLGVRIRGFPAWFAARTYHLAMMPGLGRRLRLMADWTVGLFFGRASAELGQLGHPPTLGEPPDEQRSSARRSGSSRERTRGELTFREGIPSRPARRPSPSTSWPFHDTARWMGVLPVTSRRPRPRSRTSGSAGAACSSSWPPSPAALLGLRGRRRASSATATCASWARWRS